MDGVLGARQNGSERLDDGCWLAIYFEADFSKRQISPALIASPERILASEAGLFFVFVFPKTKLTSHKSVFHPQCSHLDLRLIGNFSLVPVRHGQRHVSRR